MTDTQIYRGVPISPTHSFMADRQFTFTLGERTEECRTAEQCRMAIDDMLDTEPCALAETINPDDEVFPPRLVRAGGRSPR